MKNLQENILSSDLKKVVVISIIVTYNPSLEGISRVFLSLGGQVDQVFVVDNGSQNSQEVHQMVSRVTNARFFSLAKNFGIAHAQNVGIRAAHDLGATHVLTLDQDSVPSPDMVNKLLSVYTENIGSDKHIAAVGPLLRDETTGISLPFFSFSDGRKKRISPVVGTGNFDVGFLVSSGSLISMDSLVEVGLMQEQLFISYVDVEWGLRARSFGYQILGCCSTYMTHNLGERRLKIGRWLIPMHSPLRHFYLMRSGIYMQKLEHIPASFKRGDVIQLLRSFVLFSICGLPRLNEFLCMAKGVISGIKLKLVTAPRL
ncbi:glycosyltransferase family 2 protein [Undibacterium jejuense]|uniref:Glycosyltransferase family 2 protein n=1 Tax=Undibacterium jejuense TaxID=1344949 RepID=A0A923HT11_9BURK|nr:glycosyltransferase family 2 protein [Undibacterium jejuense]MBC3864188.1 glycosyltransferase family 2 protein [Undibacterium jejuense]